MKCESLDLIVQNNLRMSGVTIYICNTFNILEHWMVEYQTYSTYTHPKQSRAWITDIRNEK